MPTRRGRFLRSLVATVTLTVIVAGIPAVLIAIARWPLPTVMPDWSRVRVALRQGDLPAEVVVNTLAVVVWIIWIQLAWAVAYELATALRQRHDPVSRPPRAAPVVPSLFGNAMGRLVAVALSVGIATTSVSATLARATPAAAVAAAPPPPTRVAVVADAVPAPAGPHWVVATGDTCWDIAVTALGDGGRVPEILQLNPTVSPRHLRVGHVLTMPADAHVPADREPVRDSPATPEPAEATAVVFVPAETITIEAGDNLWALSEDRLDLADGPGTAPAPSAVAGYLDTVIATNVVPSGDPSVIHPNEQYTFPAIGIPPAEPPIDTPPAERRPTQSPPTQSPPTQPPASMPPPTTVAATTLPTIAPPATSPTMTEPPSNTAGTPPPASAPVAANDPHDQTSTAWPWLAGISGATVLASGLLTVYRRLRRRQASAGAAAIPATRPTGRPHEVELAIVAAADQPLTIWAGHHLATLLYGLEPATVIGAPAAVELSDSGIELLWDTPNPTASPPWTTAEDGWAWHLAYDPDERVVDDPEPAPLPGLVTIGTRDGNQVLVDLEALGTLTVTGDHQRAEDFIRAVVLELATGDHLSDSWIDLAGPTIHGTDHLARIRHTDPVTACARLRTTIAQHDDVLHRAGLDTSFQLRTSSPPGGHELAAAIVDRGEADIEFVPPHRGVVLVVLGEPGDDPTGATFTIDADGNATLQPLGLTVVAAGVPAPTSADIATLLDQAAVRIELPDEPHAFDDPLGDARSGESAADQLDLDLDEAVTQLISEHDADESTLTAPSFDVLVRVLGTPHVDGHPLPDTETNVVAYVVTNRRRATADQTINAVWNGRAIKRATLWNKNSTIRHALGDHMLPTEGETIRFADTVGTDLQLLAALAAIADDASGNEAIELLSRALDLVEGVPFDAPGYDWAHEEQHHAHAEALIESTTLRLVDLALDANDTATARHALSQGLRALPLNEPLYRARMRLEHHVGNTGAVRNVYAELTGLLNDLDTNGTYQPSGRTRALLDELAGT